MLDLGGGGGGGGGEGYQAIYLQLFIVTAVCMIRKLRK